MSWAFLHSHGNLCLLTVKDFTFVTWNSLSELTKNIEWINALQFLGSQGPCGSCQNSFCLFVLPAITTKKKQLWILLSFTLFPHVATHLMGSIHASQNSCQLLLHKCSNPIQEFPKWVTKGSYFYHHFQTSE